MQATKQELSLCNQMYFSTVVPREVIQKFFFRFIANIFLLVCRMITIFLLTQRAKLSGPFRYIGPLKKSFSPKKWGFVRIFQPDFELHQENFSWRYWRHCVNVTDVYACSVTDVTICKRHWCHDMKTWWVENVFWRTFSKNVHSWIMYGTWHDSKISFWRRQ